MTPEEFRRQFMLSRGMTLDTSPIPQIPVQAERIVPTEAPPPAPPPVIRTNPDGTIAGNITSNPTDNPDQWKIPPAPASVPPPAYAKPPAFPPAEVAPIPNVPPATGPAGITLNSAPVAPGWAGTVGLPAPDQVQAFGQGQNYEKAMAGLDEIAKGFKGPKTQQTDLTTITPMSSQPNQPGQLSAELMNTLLQAKRRPRGLTLTG